MPEPPRTVHHFSVDVEDYFQVNAFEAVAPRDTWDTFPTRVARNVDAILELLARHGATGTFFTLGWVARKDPAIVRRIAEAGHEVASHGDWHRRITTLSAAEFRTDVRDAKASLEDVSGRPVVGFRAPSFSIVPGLEWAFDVLLEEGYAYDSSIFPIRRRGYGWPGAPTTPYLIRRPAGVLREYPLATWRVGTATVPAAGGGYLRHFPFAVVRSAFAQKDRDGSPGMFYIHPWEIDADQPRLPVGWLTTFRHYRGLGATHQRMDALLRAFRFSSVERSPLLTVAA